ncbi:MAG: MotA/TolQ/ExbB proton channel family protein [Chitinivibrionales bacterium]|nr:MotA/TolQ/ExbB proton channel family protein [Chitinivibrionales bacterium]
MELATILGIILGFGGLATGFAIEKGNFAALLGISPMFIVFGGTLGAVMTQYTLKDILHLPAFLKEAILKPKGGSSELKNLIEVIVALAEKARREGILSLEMDITGQLSDAKYDPMLKKGVRLMVDGTEPELIKDMMENEIYIYEHQKKTAVGVFEAAGGFSPTMGIIGTVMGLIQVLGNMSNPDDLAKSVALAFIATLYGVSFANLVYLPLAGKLKGKMQKEILQKELLQAAILSIQSGENPRILREKLEVFIHE